MFATRPGSDKGHETVRHYILVCWHDGDAAAGWRFALVNPRTGKRSAFADLVALLHHLASLTGQSVVSVSIADSDKSYLDESE